MFESCNCFVVKVTRDCNLRCKYCYVADKDRYKGEVMSFDVFKALVDRICLDKSKNSRFENFSFIFHGGEPTIIGYETLKKFCSYAHSKFTENCLDFNFNIQTNGTLLDDNFFGLFHDYNFTVGMSFDGGYSSSNKARTNKDVSFYEDILKKGRKYGVVPGFLAVISKQNIDFTKKNVKFLTKKLQRNNGKWNYAEDVFNQGSCEISGTEFLNKNTIPLISLLSKNKKNTFIEDNIEQLIKRYFEARIFRKNHFTLNEKNCFGNCNTKFCGAGFRVLEISPDGSINYCGRYAKDDEISCCGSVFNQDFLATQSRKMFYRHIYIKHKILLEHHCDTCSAADLCDYGCMAFHYVKEGTFGIREDLVCEYYKNLKKYFLENEGELFDKYFNLIRKNETLAYLQVPFEVTPNLCRKARKVIPLTTEYAYNISPDPKWKSEDGKCYQYEITRTAKKKKFFKRKCK